MKDQVLTQASVRRLEAMHGRRSEYAVRALPGLWLRCEPSGSKTWYLRTRIKRQSVPLRIGPVEVYSLAEAIAEAQAKLRQIVGGTDPREVERAKAEAQAAAAAEIAAAVVEENTVAVVVENWFRREMANRRTLHKIRLMFLKDVIPEVGDKPITQVTKADMVRIINAVVDRGAVIGARRLFSTASGFFRWCIDQDLITQSPMQGMRRPGGENERDRFLSDAEIPFFWQAASGLGPFGLSLQMLLLTGARRGEITGLRWSEIDMKAGLIRLSGSRVKRLPKRAAEGHTIPLSTAMLAVLAQCPRPASGDGFVFSDTNGEQPIQSYERKVRTVLLKRVAALRAAAGLANQSGGAPTLVPAEPFVAHDLRRSAVVGMQAMGVPFDVLEAIVAHVGVARAGVAGVYRRHDYGAERREALQRWGAFVAKLVEPPPVVRRRVSE